MKILGDHHRSIARRADEHHVTVIDQTTLPHSFEFRTLRGESDVRDAIRTMVVRGAPLIGVTGAYGLAMALVEDSSEAGLDAALARIAATRPTAVNLRWALGVVAGEVRNLGQRLRAEAAFAVADRLAEEDVASNAALAAHGAGLVRQFAEARGTGQPVNILTHCNTGWLACVDWGTALGVIYKAHEDGIAVHVWVDETRPRNQGAALTAWELGAHGVAHTLIADNAGGHLMQQGRVDLCIVGADRIAANGDAANKIGTYLKAVAAADNAVPFYVAAPRSTIDWSLPAGVGGIDIEERPGDEVTHIAGALADGTLARVRIAPAGTHAANPAFDVTPARLITAIITEAGVAPASVHGLEQLKPHL